MINQFVQSPVESQDFIWMADYSDGTFLSEYDFNSKKENSFYDIYKKNLIRFGLVGCGMNLFYEVFGGTFKISGKMLEFIYKVDGKEYYLTGQQQMYNDIIQFKNAESNFDPLGRSGSIESMINQYNFGYKQKLNMHDVNFNFKAICSIPYGQPIYMNLRLVADRDLNGVFCIKKNGIIVAEIEAPLQKNMAGEINWIFQ